MKVLPFTSEHTQQAKKLAELSFIEENQRLNNILPNSNIPDLPASADNNLGVAAFDGDRMLGYICCYAPLRNLFGTSNGVYSPLYANGAQKQNRQKIYSAMYQYASNSWVEKKLLSHVITIYANDKEALNSFFDNGFGKRCVDAIADINSFPCKLQNEDMFSELAKNQFDKVHHLSNMTIKHLQKSPCFMPNKEESLNSFLNDITDDVRIFTAQRGGKTAAYLKIQNNGETFISKSKNMINLTGAYVLDEFRGSGIATDLLNYVINVLKNEKFTHLGVDFESINPAANSFWQKYFIPYTYSLTRRIDERIIE